MFFKKTLDTVWMDFYNHTGSNFFLHTHFWCPGTAPALKGAPHTTFCRIVVFAAEVRAHTHVLPDQCRQRRGRAIYPDCSCMPCMRVHVVEIWAGVRVRSCERVACRMRARHDDEIGLCERAYMRTRFLELAVYTSGLHSNPSCFCWWCFWWGLYIFLWVKK